MVQADAADLGDEVLDDGEVVGDRLGALGTVEEVGEVLGQRRADAGRPLDGVGELRRVGRRHRDDRVRRRRSRRAASVPVAVCGSISMPVSAWTRRISSSTSASVDRAGPERAA